MGTKKFLLVSIIAGVLLVGVFVMRGFEKPEVVLAGGHDETISGGTVVFGPGTHTRGNLTIDGTGILVLQANCTTNIGVTIRANNITILTGGSITANGQGCAGGHWLFQWAGAFRKRWSRGRCGRRCY